MCSDIFLKLHSALAGESFAYRCVERLDFDMSSWSVAWVKTFESIKAYHTTLSSSQSAGISKCFVDASPSREAVNDTSVECVTCTQCVHHPLWWESSTFIYLQIITRPWLACVSEVCIYRKGIYHTCPSLSLAAAPFSPQAHTIIALLEEKRYTNIRGLKF